MRPPATTPRARPAAARRRRARRAFTLVELLVVITVIAILAGMLMAALAHARWVVRIKATSQLLTQIGMSVAQYADAYGEAPPEKAPGNLRSSECLALFLGRGLLGGEKSLPQDDQRAIQSKREFLTLKKSLVFDHDDNDYVELIDAWGLPIVYNRPSFPGSSTTWADANDPPHNPASYDLFSCGPQASRIPELGGQLPNVGAFEQAAVSPHGNPQSSDFRYLYQYEHRKVGRRVNEYIGNW